MPDQFSPEVKSAPLETDIAEVHEEVQRHKENLEADRLSDREILKKSIQSLTANVVQKGEDNGKSASDDDILSSAPPGAKLEIEELLSLAFKYGIQKAAREASKSSPFVLDAFHDELTGHFYEEFKKRGLL